MAYRFSLAPVLRLRESLEEHDLHSLEQTQHEIARVVSLLESLELQQSSVILDRECALNDGTCGADLHLREQLCNEMHARRAVLEETLAGLQVRRSQQLTNYECSKRKRQVLSDLRDRQLEAHDSKADHQQQRITDDGFLARRNRE